MKKVCVYCGSSAGSSDVYKDGAQSLAREMVKQKVDLVYGGASVGIMGIIADTVLAEGGDVTGIIPESLDAREISHQGLTELFVVDTMHDRKSGMARLSDGFIAMPGGLGTLEEIFEVLTWAQLGMHHKPCALLNIGGYFDGLVQFIDHAVEQGFVKPLHRGMLLVEENPEKLLTAMNNYRAPTVEKWIGRSET